MKEEEITNEDIRKAVEILRKSSPDPNDDIAFFSFCYYCDRVHIFSKKSSEECKNSLEL